MTTAFLQDVRYLVLYPLMVVGGLAWLGAFFLRWRKTRCRGDLWLAVLAGSIAFWALFGLIALWVASSTGFNVTTSLAFTIGMMAPTMILAWGAVALLWQAWRHG